MLPEPVAEAARAQWGTLDGRGRRQVILAARRGLPVAADHAAIAVLVADKELRRLGYLMRPLRLNIWRGLHLLFAVWFVVAAFAAARDEVWPSAVVLAAFAALFASSAALAKKRLERRVARVTARRSENLLVALGADDADSMAD